MIPFSLAPDLYLAIMALFFFFVAFSIFGRKHNKQPYLSYIAKTTLFSPAELSFYFVLQQALSEDCMIFGKVRIADVIQPDKSLIWKLRSIALNKISSKHFDFVICDSKTFLILAVVELDDKSHNSFRAIKRDKFVNEACKSAGITLIRFRAKPSYQIQQVRDTIDAAFVSS